MLKSASHYLIAATLAMVPAAATALDSSYYAPTSRLASGKWVKISAPREGIYEISYNQLRSMGFSDPQAVQVWGYSATALPLINSAFKDDFPDDIAPTATLHSGSKLLFYSQGQEQAVSQRSADVDGSIQVARTFYDTSSYFFLSETGVQDISRRRAATPSSAKPVASHVHIELFEDEVQNPTDGGNDFHGAEIRAGQSVDYPFTIKNFQPTVNAKNASFNYKAAVKSNSSTRLGVTVPSGVTVTYSNDVAATPINEQTFEAYHYTNGYRYFTPDGDGDYTFTVTAPTTSFDYCAPQRAVVRYPRANSLDAADPFLVMNLHEYENLAGQTIDFPGQSAEGLHVWNIDDLTSISAYTPSSTDEGARLVLDVRTKRIVAFDPSYSFPSPEVIGTVKAQNIHGASTPDMVIITTAEIEPAAQQLAALHRQHQGMDVLVVNHKDVYNEFSSGARDPMAYRRMAKMFYDRDPGKFRYLLFFGPANFDARNINIPAGTEAPDRMVCYEQDNQSYWISVVLNYAPDAYFAMLDDSYKHEDIHYTLSNISVGRIPAMNISQASNYVNKAKRHFETPTSPEVYSRMLVIAGNGDDGDHARHGNEVNKFVKESRPEMTLVNVFREAYPSAEVAEGTMSGAIAKALESGTGYLSYSGHGSPTSINSWNINNATTQLYDNPAFVMFSSCDQFAFDRQHNGLTEAMLFTPRGGAIAGLGACRSVYINSNQVACVPMAKMYAEAKPGDTFGELHMRARNTAVQARLDGTYQFAAPLQAFRNLLSYNLAGDPALPVYAPSRGAKLTSVGSTEVTSETPGEAPTLRSTSFKGEITLADGQTDTGFNGQVIVVVFDGVHEQKTVTHNNEINYKSQTVEIGSDELARGTGSVSGGKFTVDISLPIPTYPAAKYRVGIYALNEAGDGALGTYEELIINDDPLDPSEQTAPQIMSLNVASEPFKPGYTTGTAIVTATLDPSPAGLTFKTGDVSSRSRLTFDRLTQIAIDQALTANGDGTMSLRLSIPDVTLGEHTVELLLVNNAGLSDRRSASFSSTADSFSTSLSVAEDPAREEATFSLSTDGQADRLYITDAEGNTVFSVDKPSFPLKWDLTDQEGRQVGDGHYQATVLTSTPAEHAHDSIEVIVLRK